MGISPNAGYVQTVQGIVSPESLGITLPHEHLLIDQTVGGVYFVEPEGASDRILAHQPVCLENLWWVRRHMKDNYDNQFLLDEHLAAREASLFYLRGGGTIVDQTNIGIGRDPGALLRISRATGLNIVMGCGFYVDGPSTQEERDSMDVEDFASRIVQDMTVGVDQTRIKSGIIGELGCTWPLKPNEKKVLEAAALAQQQSGASINVHPGRNDEAPLEIIDVLQRAGADLSRVVMSHMDRCGYALDTRLRLLDAGCFVEYDLFGFEGYYPARVALAEGHLPDTPNDVGRIKEMRDLIGRGYLTQILMSHDIGMKMQLTAYGGWGYAHIVRDVVPLMYVYGYSQQEVDTLMIENPKRLLTLV
ncbi:MAG: aryldialkylphosphatase [Dehalococcoidia bacterium]|nr:aryldialkylphosphatase [Dehalococcoidia bacterium]